MSESVVATGQTSLNTDLNSILVSVFLLQTHIHLRLDSEN